LNHEANDKTYMAHIMQGKARNVSRIDCMDRTKPSTLSRNNKMKGQVERKAPPDLKRRILELLRQKLRIARCGTLAFSPGDQFPRSSVTHIEP
jgi:hypothetical protein